MAPANAERDGVKALTSPRVNNRHRKHHGEHKRDASSGKQTNPNLPGRNTTAIFVIAALGYQSSARYAATRTHRRTSLIRRGSVLGVRSVSFRQNLLRCLPD